MTRATRLWLACLLIFGAAHLARAQDQGPYTVLIELDFEYPVFTCLESGQPVPLEWAILMYVSMDGLGAPSPLPGAPANNLNGFVYRKLEGPDGECEEVFEEGSGSGHIDPYLMSFNDLRMRTEGGLTLTFTGAGTFPAMPSSTECYERSLGPTVLVFDYSPLALPIPVFVQYLEACPG